jgi:hypothetical protein
MADFVRPRSRYFVFDRNDPQPFLRDVGQILGKIFSRNKDKPAAKPVLQKEPSKN